MVFEITEDPMELRIEFSSVMSNIDMVELATRKYLTRMGLGAHVFAVCLVMREALTNAVKHGNGSDEKKLVDYAISFQNDSIIIQIEDQGDGFVWRDALATDIPGPDKESGRGFSIIKRYFSSWKFNDRGNRIILTKII